MPFLADREGGEAPAKVDRPGLPTKGVTAGNDHREYPTKLGAIQEEAPERPMAPLGLLNSLRDTWEPTVRREGGLPVPPTY